MTVAPVATRSLVTPKLKLKITASTRRRLKLRKEFWPEVDENSIWVRANFTGFTSIPRTMPIIIKIINDLDRKNAGNVFFDMWCRAFEDFMVEIKDEYECALSSGYEGQRAIRSWRERVEVLENFEIVKTKKAPHGAYRYILILEPHKTITELYKNNKVSAETMSALENQLISIGATK